MTLSSASQPWKEFIKEVYQQSVDILQNSEETILYLAKLCQEMAEKWQNMSFCDDLD